MAYIKVEIFKINPDANLPADIFLCLNEKYIKFKNQGESLSQEKYDSFMSKGIKYLYIEEKDDQRFHQWIEDKNAQEIEAFVNQAGEENRDAIVASKEMQELVYDVFSDESLNLEKVDRLQENVQDFVEKMRTNSHYSQALTTLVGRSNSIASHSVAVGNLSVFIAMSLGFGHQFALENIYLASLFHDYGKLKIPENILSNPNHVDYLELLHAHPDNSVQIIRKSKGIPEQVIKMIQEHHEYWDGSGYPKGLSGDNLYKNSPILSLSNELEQYLSDNQETSDIERYKIAIDMVRDGGAVKWPESFYPRIIEALELGFISQRGLEN